MLIRSEPEMISFGRNYAAKLRAPVVLELLGDVGAGKTTFVRGLAAGLGIEEPVTSPSFTISKEYQGKSYRLVHYDFYRLANPGIMAEDLAENLADNNTITVVEWGESIRDILPAIHPVITIKYINETEREVEVK